MCVCVKLFYPQAWSGRREANMGYTQLAVKVEQSEDGDVDDTTELMT